jgi:hypothetical protein
LKHLQLMAQGEHFKVKSGPRPRQSSKRQQKGDLNGHHRNERLCFAGRQFNDGNAYRVLAGTG